MRMHTSRLFMLVVGVLLLGIGGVLVRDVQAGGCCFKSFSAEVGIANKQEAVLKVAFVDPKNPHADPGKTILSSLVDTKIAIHIISPKSGQTCHVLSERTDSAGGIEARCSSSTPGSIAVYFSAPELDAESNQMIRSVLQYVEFVHDPVAQQTNTINSIPVVSPQPQPVQNFEQLETPVASAKPISLDEGQESLELQERVTELEQQVEEQKQEVSFLKAVVQRLLDTFAKLFS